MSISTSANSKIGGLYETGIEFDIEANSDNYKNVLLITSSEQNGNCSFNVLLSNSKGEEHQTEISFEIKAEEKVTFIKYLRLTAQMLENQPIK